MIRTVSWDGRFAEEARRLDPEMLLEIRYHGDVPEGMAAAAVSGKRFAGFGLLRKSARFWDLEFRGIPGRPDEAEASIALLEALEQHFLEHRNEDPEDRRGLRVFIDEKAEAYRELLEEYIFSAGEKMLVMEKELREEDAVFPEEGEPTFREMDLRDAALTEAYFRGCAESFEAPNSREDLLFRTAHLGARILLRTDGSRILSAVTVWPLEEGVWATENVFTDPCSRREGHAEAVLRYALREIRRQGAKKARLNVYENAKTAVRLYEKLGYQKIRRLLEMTRGEEER